MAAWGRGSNISMSWRTPTRLLAGGGPSTPDARVLRALTTPLIGQFDPAFTAIMDEVMQLARQVLLTSNARCYPVSALARGGLESVINTLVEPGDHVSVRGSTDYTADVEDIARRYGAEIGAQSPKLTIVPHVDPETGERRPITSDERESGFLVVDATQTLGGCELRTDDWGIDVVVAGVDACLGAPSGMTLVTYTDRVEQAMRSRHGPPPTSYLDLLQLQAYWSPERLNHHTAPTSLVYGLREALRLVLEEGLEQRWRRHARVGAALRAGLMTLGLGARRRASAFHRHAAGGCGAPAATGARRIRRSHWTDRQRRLAHRLAGR